MKQAEAEKAIRHLCSEWLSEKLIIVPTERMLSYTEFKVWAEQTGYGGYWDFRAIPGADYVAEIWFDQETRQTWRN